MERLDFSYSNLRKAEKSDGGHCWSSVLDCSSSRTHQKWIRTPLFPSPMVPAGTRGFEVVENQYFEIFDLSSQLKMSFTLTGLRNLRGPSLDTHATHMCAQGYAAVCLQLYSLYQTMSCRLGASPFSVWRFQIGNTHILTEWFFLLTCWYSWKLWGMKARQGESDQAGGRRGLNKRPLRRTSFLLLLFSPQSVAFMWKKDKQCWLSRSNLGNLLLIFFLLVTAMICNNK